MDTGNSTRLHRGKASRVSIEKMHYPFFRDLFRLNPEKLGHELQYMVKEWFHNAHDDRGDWLEMPTFLAYAYMTTLANTIASEKGLGALTSKSSAESILLSARKDSSKNLVQQFDYPMYHHHHDMRVFAEGILAQLSIESIQIADSVSIDRLQEFKERYCDELAAFRTAVGALLNGVDVEHQSITALKQAIRDIHTNNVKPAVSNLKRALKGRRVLFLTKNLLQISTISMGSGAMLVHAGLPVPIALLAGAGISMTASAITYNADREDTIRNNPYSYLLHIQKDL